MPPDWLETVSAVVLALSAAGAAFVIADLATRPQRMWIMSLVWPLAALYGGPLGLWAYLAVGRPPRGSRDAGRDEPSGRRPAGDPPPFWHAVLKGSTHCGAGCALGDFAAEWIAVGGGVAVFGSRLAGKFLLAFLLAYAAGLFFQYFAIAPMRGLGPGEGLRAAAKADTLSLLAYEVGMFGVMAAVQLALLPGLGPATWTFWFLMQVAMLAGLATTFPVNAWLIRRGVKEAM